MPTTSCLPCRSRAPPEAFLSTRELVEELGSGYGIEEHHVTTPDGYILTIYKITCGEKKNPNYGTKEPILIVHGFWISSDVWLVSKPIENNLAYLLTEQGYEVWLGNFRGNNNSTGHTTLTQKDLQYWDFSIDQLGLYDVPSMIRYVLNDSKKDSMSYIGYSMGTATFFMAMIHNPDLQPKIRKMIALAPAAYVNHSKTFTRNLRLVPSTTLLKIFKFIARGRILPKWADRLLRRRMPHLFSLPGFSRVGLYLVFLSVGFDWDQITPDSASLILGHLFSPTSGKILVHWYQLMRHGKFQAFDYGPRQNLIEYNSESPPLYDLANVKVPVKVLYGLKDRLVVPQDAQRLIKELGNVVESGAVKYEKFSHLDFIFAKDVKTLVFEECVQFLESESCKQDEECNRGSGNLEGKSEKCD